jgi:hypothetical protein
MKRFLIFQRNTGTTTRTNKLLERGFSLYVRQRDI